MKLTTVFIWSSVLILLSFLIWGEGLEISFKNLLETFRNSPQKYVWFSFLILTSDIILPVPSSITMFINGNVIGLWPGLFLSLASVLCSSVIGYFMGKGLGYGLKQNSNEKADLLLKRYGPYILILTRGIPILSESFCFVCGYNKMTFIKYMFYSFLGYLPVCAIYSYFGSISNDSELFLWTFGGAMLIALIFAIIGRLMSNRLKLNDEV
jgi:uncharacterized membrane protein YdjX (TVP38/TMEM64 family)